MSIENISTHFSYTSRFLSVNGAEMHYIEEGQGDPILFIHGVPTSVYLWRNIIPHLNSLGRCIAVDLMGFGKSEKPAINYTYKDQIQYLEQFIEKLNLKNITFVLHGWGSIIGFDFVMRNSSLCKALVFYESYIKPADEENVSLAEQEQNFVLTNNEHDIYKSVVQGTHFVDQVLPMGMMRPLSPEEMFHYREPFLQKNSEKPLLQYLKELPRNKNETNATIAQYSQFLQHSNIPKLMLYSVPGFITTISSVIWAKENFKNLEVIEIGEALHYAQETNPILMGEAISVWLQGLEQNQRGKP